MQGTVYDFYNKRGPSLVTMHVLDVLANIWMTRETMGVGVPPPFYGVPELLK